MHRPEPFRLLLAMRHDHERAGERQQGRLDERRRRAVEQRPRERAHEDPEERAAHELIERHVHAQEHEEQVAPKLEQHVEDAAFRVVPGAPADGVRSQAEHKEPGQDRGDESGLHVVR